MKKLIYGFLIGLINSMLGCGGGIIAVPMFKKYCEKQKNAHANTVMLIMLLSLISAIIYMYSKRADISDALNFIPFGIIGSFIGSVLMSKIPDNLLRKVFACFMIFSGVRMIFK